MLILKELALTLHPRDPIRVRLALLGLLQHRMSSLAALHRRANIRGGFRREDVHLHPRRRLRRGLVGRGEAFERARLCVCAGVEEAEAEGALVVLCFGDGCSLLLGKLVGRSSCVGRGDNFPD